MSDKLDILLEYLDMGLSIIPVAAGTKIPAKGFKWSQYQQRQPTPEEVEAWHEAAPDANWAMVTGAVSGYWALDADGQVGQETLARGDYPTTSVYNHTPNNGVHALYRLPRGARVSNGVKVAPGLDVRGEGGYILIPPSIISGKAYAWEFIQGFNGWDDVPEWTPPNGLLRAAAVNDKGIDLSGVQPAAMSRDAAQGERNSYLASMVGQWLRKFDGICQEELEVLAKGWNREHCRPPLGEAEVRLVVRSIWGRHHQDMEEEIQAQIYVPDQTSTVFPEHLLKPGGLLQSIMDYTAASSAASHPVYSLAGAISLLGTVAGQRVQTETGLRTNFYNIAVGYSGSGKDAPHSAAQALLGASNTLRPMLGPHDLPTAPAVINWLATPERAITLLTIDEIGLIFKRTGKSGNTWVEATPQLLMTLWSSTDRGYIKAYADSTNDKNIRFHHLSLYGATTPSRFWEALSSGMMSDGFAARMLAFQSTHAPSPPQEAAYGEIPLKLVDELEAIARLLRLVEYSGNMDRRPNPYKIPMSVDAREIVNDWTVQLYKIIADNAHDDVASAMYGRMREHALKLALVRAVSRCGRKVPDELIEAEDLEWAIAMVEYIVPNTLEQARENIAESEFERLQNKVKSIVRRCIAPGRPGATLREIYKALKTTKDNCDKILGTMVASGVLVKIEYKPDRGRPSELFCLAIG